MSRRAVVVTPFPVPARGIELVTGRAPWWMRLLAARTLFFLIVVCPTLGASVYYTFFAAPEYVSEAEYIVRGVSSRHASGLDALFSTFGISRTVDDTFAIQDYLRSRNVIAEVDKAVPLRVAFARPEADALARFPHPWRGASEEMLYEYYRSAVTVRQDAKGISTLKVVAFRAVDARDIARALIAAAERMVNTMNERAQRDTLRNLREDVRRAEDDVVAAQAQLTAFRNREAVVDPQEYSVKILETIGELQTNLSQTRSEILETEKVSPLSPRLGGLRARATALSTSIEEQRAKLGGNSTSLAAKVSLYDRLSLARDLADKRLASNLAAMEAGRRDARSQQIYIEEIASPNLPDQAIEPQRSRAVLSFAVMGFAIFCMAWLILVGAKEHAQ